MQIIFQFPKGGCFLVANNAREVSGFFFDRFTRLHHTFMIAKHEAPLRKPPSPPWNQELHQALETYLRAIPLRRENQARRARLMTYDLIDTFATIIKRELRTIPPNVMRHLAEAQQVATTLNVPIVTRELTLAIDTACNHIRKD